jgi:hypothetical protein
VLATQQRFSPPYSYPPVNLFNWGCLRAPAPYQQIFPRQDLFLLPQFFSPADLFFPSQGALACGLRFGLGGRDFALFPVRDSHPTSDSVSLEFFGCRPRFPFALCTEPVSRAVRTLICRWFSLSAQPWARSAPTVFLIGKHASVFVATLIFPLVQHRSVLLFLRR